MTNPPVFLEGFARPTLILHAILGVTAVGAATHLAVYALFALRGRAGSGLRRFAWLAPALAVPQFAVGLCLYPVYRLRVRVEDFDKNAPFVAQLFDLKEHLAAIGLALLIAAAVLARIVSRRTSEGGRSDFAPALAAVSGSSAALLWAVAILGLYVTARHPVGMP